MTAITHVALRVEDLDTAASYYRDLFELTPEFHEAEVDGQWRTLRPDSDPETAREAGVDLDLSYLSGEGLELALERAAEVDQGSGTRLSHVGLDVSRGELDRIRDRIADLDCPIHAESDRTVVFEDAYGVTWEVAVDYDATSTGDRTGRWIDL